MALQTSVEVLAQMFETAPTVPIGWLSRVMGDPEVRNPDTVRYWEDTSIYFVYHVDGNPNQPLDIRVDLHKYLLEKRFYIDDNPNPKYNVNRMVYINNNYEWRPARVEATTPPQYKEAGAITKANLLRPERKVFAIDLTGDTPEIVFQNTADWSHT